MVEAIGKLWTLAFVVLLILRVVFFRREIKSMLVRMSKFQFKRGQTEISITQEAQDIETGATLESREEAVSEEAPATEPRDKTRELEPSTSDDWINKMMLAFFKRDIKSADEAFNKAKQLESNAVKKLRNEALYLWLRYDYGDTTALAKLQDIAKKDELDIDVRHEAQRYIGHCYQSAGSFDKAVETYEVAVQLSQTQTERAMRSKLLLAFKNYNRSKTHIID